MDSHIYIYIPLKRISTICATSDVGQTGRSRAMLDLSTPQLPASSPPSRWMPLPSPSSTHPKLLRLLPTLPNPTPSTPISTTPSQYFALAGMNQVCHLFPQSNLSEVEFNKQEQGKLLLQSVQYSQQITIE